MTKAVQAVSFCRCRNCGAKYEEDKSRAEFKGYCTQACLHEKARKHGYKKITGKYKWTQKTEFDILSAANMIGSRPWED